MRREYKIRGKLVSVNELEGIRAIKPTFKTNEFFKSIENTFDKEARNLFKSIQADFPKVKEQLRSFSDAGWVFIKPTENNLQKLDNRSFELPTIDVSSKVYHDEDDNVLVSTNRINLKLLPDISISMAREFLDQNHLELIREQGYAPNLFEVTIEANDVIDIANELSASDKVVYAEPQMILYIPQRFKPTDPLYSSQWHLNNDGSNGSVKGADIKSELAWDTSRGRGIKLAIIDNGFDVRHTDLSPSIHSSSGYFTQTSLSAVFQKGLIGYPNNSHGTFCAGIAVARENNGMGGCGIAHHSDFIAIACLGDQVGTQVTLARAIAYASNPSLELPGTPSGMGADIISCSLGPNGAKWRMESVLEDAINYAVQKGRGGKGTLVFWAVSNGNFTIDGIDGTDEVSAFANTISVGRSRSDDMEDGSAYGSELDFLAPGVDIFSTIPGDGYGVNTGTSFATPLAAGAAAVILSKNPNLTWIQVRDALRKSCNKIGGVTYNSKGHHKRYGYGRINLYDALKLV